ncbi:hypothetical protein [Terrihabitans rhizophilus]|uniref:Tripartite tricarboxylate transporter TctB family protein n=1 Tax=Terrihabitans rhizophilus TaxID=3092662 RepID=A0ABU4RRZ7_9HYPH|nr:hypothetical protein [Terrihabitans sp. PJ23]MDX6805531.1 hypothetical protein [Terrihabitans sp. PJ23]
MSAHLEPEVTSGEAAPRNATGGDWIIPVIAAGFATYYLFSIRDLVWEAKIAAVFVAVVLYALIAVFVVTVVVGLRRGALRVDFTPLWENAALFRVRGLLFLLAVLSVAALPWAGFTLSTFFFLLASFLWLEKMSPRMALITAASLAFGGYVLFIAILRTTFPLGPFELAARALTGL